MRRSLKVHPTQRPAPRVVRQTALRQLLVESMLSQFATTPRAREVTAIVADRLEFDEKGAGQFGRMELHEHIPRQATFGSGIGMMKRPPRR